MYDEPKNSWLLWLLLAAIFAYYGFNSRNYFALGTGLAFLALGIANLTAIVKNNTKPKS